MLHVSTGQLCVFFGDVVQPSAVILSADTPLQVDNIPQRISSGSKLYVSTDSTVYPRAPPKRQYHKYSPLFFLRARLGSACIYCIYILFFSFFIYIYCGYSIISVLSVFHILAYISDVLISLFSISFSLVTIILYLLLSIIFFLI